MKRSGDEWKQMYASAVDDYKAGRLEDARGKFEKLRDAGFKPGWFQKSPGDYLNEVNAKIARMAPPPAPAEQPPAAQPEMANNPPAEQPHSEPPAPQPEVAAQPAPVEQPTVVPQQPVAMQPVATSPAEEAPTAHAEPAPSNGHTEPTPAVTVAPAVPPEMPAQPAEVRAAQARPETAKEAYQLGKSQYNSGDWIAARQNFKWAKELGYKPGWFETSPDKYLARMDAKEAKDGVNRGAQMAQADQVDADGKTAAQRAAESQQLVAQAETRASQRQPRAPRSIFMIRRTCSIPATPPLQMVAAR